uniref:Activating transcription factor 7-interacting protein Fn3 domain-containing protein n=1 Tax=Scophthalmus maximus TaxID=52904 RepID=A0A8D3A812_SCOMX
MAEVQDEGFPAGDSVNRSSRATKRTRMSQKLTCTSRKRARVDIGLAYERWREVKATEGLRSDAEVAQCLLDEMKRLPSTPTSSGANHKKIKVSQSEVQTLIEQEVHSAVKTNETKLQCLIETIENLDRGVDFECTIQKLETRINTLTKRTEAALAHMTKTQKKSQHPSPVNVDIIRIDSEDEAVETVSQSKESMDRTGKSGEFLQVMETTKEEMMKMRADNEAWEAAMEDLREISAPPVPTPQGSPECNKNVDKSRTTEEPEAATMRVESPSSGRDNIPKHTGSGQRNVKLLYPPLPSTTVPSVLDSEAASFNIPQGPEVHLALIRDPPGLSVLWKVVEEDPCAPPMDSYSIFMTSEKVKGSGVFRKWKMLGEVKAITLPMCVMVTKYKPGHKVCVAVVGKDTFGRWGPYSKVVTAAIPASLG